MKASIALAIAVLGTAANIAWAGNMPEIPAPPSSPPLHCACVVGNPSA